MERAEIVVRVDAAEMLQELAKVVGAMNKTTHELRPAAEREAAPVFLVNPPRFQGGLTEWKRD